MAQINLIEEEKKWIKELSNETGIEDIEDQKYVKIKESRVVYLALGNLNLESIPPSVFKFRFLETLYLARNKLNMIPKEILNLEHLRILSISHNLFKTLPDILGKIYSLNVLDYSNNPIDEIPDWIENLFQLVEIHMGPLKKYKNPSRISQFKNITYFSSDDELWHRNSIVGKFFKGVKFSASEIKGIRSLEKMTNRKMQKLYGWKEFESEGKDMGLKYYRNKIYALKVMNLTYSELPLDVDSFYALNYLKCKGDWNLSNLPKLSKIFHRGVRLVSEEIKVLLELESFLGKSIPYRDMELINNWGNINGDIVDFGFDIRANHVVCLCLENQNLSEIPKIILKFPYLRILNLNKNHIRVIPDWLSKLEHLTQIILNFGKDEQDDIIIQNKHSFLENVNSNEELLSWYPIKHLQNISFNNKITFQEWIDIADKYTESGSSFADLYISEDDWHKLFLSYIPLAELMEAPIFCPKEYTSKIILLHVNLNTFKDHYYDFYSIIYQKLAQHVWAYYFFSIPSLFGDQKATVWDFHNQNSELIYAFIEPESKTKVWAFASPSFETCFAFQEYCMTDMMGKLKKTREFSFLTPEILKLIEGGKQMMNLYPLNLREIQNELYKYRI